MPTITDINLEARDLCDADTTSYPAATLLRRINAALEKVISWILEADGTWQWDDTNYTDLPIGTQTLVNAQSAYSFNDKFLEIEEVQIKDVDGNWHIIRPLDQKEYSDNTPLSEAFEADGMPAYYDKVSDDTFKLFPAPDNGLSVTLASGLKVKYRRTASIFTSAEVTTGTKVPGFVSTCHYVLSYLAALPYCMSYKKDRVAMIRDAIGDFEEPRGFKKDILKHYSRREQDKRKIITMRKRPYK